MYVTSMDDRVSIVRGMDTHLAFCEHMSAQNVQVCVDQGRLFRAGLEYELDDWI